MFKSLDQFSSDPGKALCGVDEAGRGPVIGPLVVAGVLMEDDLQLKEMGARDSKKLSPKRRVELAEKIKEIARFEYVVMSAEDIDSLRNCYSLNVIEAKMFASVIEKLDARSAIVDAADSNEDVFKRMILKELGECKIISKHEADVNYPIVSAASILAKTKRDSLVAEIENEIGRPIGSGYPSDKITIEFLKDWYTEHKEMPPHTRMSWKTVKRLINELGMTDLGSFNEGD